MIFFSYTRMSNPKEIKREIEKLEIARERIK